MKIRIAYTENERTFAEQVKEHFGKVLAKLGLTVKETRSDRHEPYHHIYLTTLIKK